MQRIAITLILHTSFYPLQVNQFYPCLILQGNIQSPAPLNSCITCALPYVFSVRFESANSALPYQHGATPHEKKPPVERGLKARTISSSLERAFSPLPFVAHRSWGVAPCWYCPGRWPSNKHAKHIRCSGGTKLRIWSLKRLAGSVREPQPNLDGA